MLLAIVGCAAPNANVGPPKQSLGAEHPLAGRLYDTRDGQFVEFSAVAAEAARTKYVLLGEKHDNPEHHAGQAAVIRAMAEEGRRPVVVWEMISRSQEPAIQSVEDADAFGAALNWEVSGWPDYAMYRPIAVAVIEAELVSAAGNLNRDEMRTAYTEGLEGLASERARSLGVERTLEGESAEDLRREIEKAHCGYGDASMLDSMSAAQQTRDAFMAYQLRARAVDGAVLVAGGGHVRKDRAVPYHLGDEAFVIAWVEVRDGKTDPKEYADGRYDIAIFTPRVTNEDPCAQFAEQIERIKKQEGR